MSWKDLTGQRYGSLTVIELMPSEPGKHRMWRCKCDCGGETVSSTYRLTTGLTSHCGCRKIRDLTGQRFGKLTVLGLSDKRAPRGKRTVILWECLCDCGEITYKATDTLKNDDVNMCSNCAGAYNASHARKSAGFTDGTQLSKLRDMKPAANNPSGVRGVQFHKQSNKWRARIKFKGKEIGLGYYHDFQDAVDARKKAEEEYYGAFLESIELQSSE